MAKQWRSIKINGHQSRWIDIQWTTHLPLTVVLLPPRGPLPNRGVRQAADRLKWWAICPVARFWSRRVRAKMLCFGNEGAYCAPVLLTDGWFFRGGNQAEDSWFDSSEGFVMICMYACMHVCTNAWMHGCMHAWVDVCMHSWMRECNVHLCYLCIFACMYAYVHVCMHIWSYMHVCICMHVCI